MGQWPMRWVPIVQAFRIPCSDFTYRLANAIDPIRELANDHGMQTVVLPTQHVALLEKLLPDGF